MLNFVDSLAWLGSRYFGQSCSESDPAWFQPDSKPATESKQHSLTVSTCLLLQNTWLGKRVLNNFSWFYNSHLFMFAVFYIAALLHPWPGLPGYSHAHGHSITWVRP